MQSNSEMRKYKKLIEEIRKVITDANSQWKIISDDIISKIKSDANNITSDNLADTLKSFNAHQINYNKAKIIKDNILGKDQGTDIDVQVFIKDIDGKQNGKLIKFNVARKALTIQYEFTKLGKVTKDTLHDIKISELCIEGENCEIPIAIGGTINKINKNDNDNENENYKIICE